MVSHLDFINASDIIALEGALCFEYGRPNLWFPSTGDYTNGNVAEAKRNCAECPVRTRCLTIHLRDEWGIYGGLTPQERHELAGGNAA